MNDLDNKLREYYRSQQLSDGRVETILESTKVVRLPRSRPRIWLAAAAVIFALLVAGAALWNLVGESLNRRVAVEVAANHSKLLAPEIRTADFARIQAALPRLEFPLGPTRPEFLMNLTVVGGRYCSIQGELAAQISLRDRDDNPCTLFVVPLNEQFESVRIGIQSVDGVAVKTWRDAQRLFVLAR